VQPPGAGWSRDPFAAEIEDGRIYARGAANSKAALAGSLLAFAGADSPCRQVLLMDGEEELGSPRLAAFCEAHRDELRADWALDFDMHESEDGTAPVVAGCKGLHELELRAGDGVDVHSSLIGSGQGSPSIRCGSGGAPARAVASDCSKAASSSGSLAVVVYVIELIRATLSATTSPACPPTW
jgi:acetylornithine deacetylase/succinyl-diaminopimelate desuccinylase-like protein